jgi:hypothetical protein
MSLAVLVLRVPEITFENEGVLPVVAQGSRTILKAYLLQIAYV